MTARLLASSLPLTLNEGTVNIQPEKRKENDFHIKFSSLRSVQNNSITALRRSSCFNRDEANSTVTDKSSVVRGNLFYCYIKEILPFTTTCCTSKRTQQKKMTLAHRRSSNFDLMCRGLRFEHCAMKSKLQLPQHAIRP